MAKSSQLPAFVLPMAGTVSIPLEGCQRRRRRIREIGGGVGGEEEVGVGGGVDKILYGLQSLKCFIYGLLWKKLADP